MAVNKISMAINYRKNKGTLNSNGKYYAEVDRQKTLSTRGLAQHLKDHNCMVGRDAIMAVLIKLSECVPELLSQGVGVKLDGLGTFYPSVQNEKGGATEAQMMDKTFNPTSIIKGIHMRFTPDGSALDNLTSRQFLQNNVAPASQNIVEIEKRTVNGKITKVQKLTTLDDFRNPGTAVHTDPTDPTDSNSGNGSGEGSGSGSGSGTGSITSGVAAPTIGGEGAFTTSTQVTMSGPEGAEIRYTTDGSTPTASSTLYTEAITVSSSVTLKAIAIKDGQSSEVTTKQFVKSDGGADDPSGFEGA